MPHGTCGVVSFGFRGGRMAAETFMKHLKLAAIETHVADARTCVLHPASATHRQMNDEELQAVLEAAASAESGTEKSPEGKAGETAKEKPGEKAEGQTGGQAKEP